MRPGHFLHGAEGNTTFQALLETFQNHRRGSRVLNFLSSCLLSNEENYIFLSCICLVTLQLFRLSGRTHKSIFFMMITYPLCSVDIIFLLFLKINPKISACFCPKQTPFINFIDFRVFFFKALQLQNLFQRAQFIYLANWVMRIDTMAIRARNTLLVYWFNGAQKPHLSCWGADLQFA